MKHNLFINHANRGAFVNSKGSHDRVRFSGGFSGRHNREKKKKDRREEKTSGDQFLVILINQLLERYKKNPDVISKIGDKAEMFALNRTIAREMGDDSAEKQLTEKFIAFLKSI